MKKLSQKGVVDLHFVGALLIVIVVGAFVLLRISNAGDETDSAANDAVKTTEELPEIETIIAEAKQDNPDAPTDVEVGLEEGAEEVEEPEEGSDTATFSSTRVTDFKQFIGENEFGEVAFGELRLQLPIDWDQSSTKSDFGNWLNLTSPDGEAEIAFWDFDGTESLAYTSCEYFTQTPSVLYDQCERTQKDGDIAEFWAATILKENEAANRPQDDAGAQWRDVIVHDNDGFYYQARFTQNPGAIDYAVVFDYLVDTLKISQ